MTYCYQDRSFLFRSMDEVQTCPMCDGTHLSPVTPEEAEQLRAVLQERVKFKEEEK